MLRGSGGFVVCALVAGLGLSLSHSAAAGEGTAPAPQVAASSGIAPASSGSGAPPRGDRGKATERALAPSKEPEYGDHGGAYREFSPRVELAASLRARTELQLGHALGHVPVSDRPDPFARYTQCDSEGRCDLGAQSSAELRLRLEPTLLLSRRVRLEVMLDAFDGALAGSSPTPLYSGSSPSLPLFGSTQRGSSLLVRRAVAVLEQGPLVLRFGRAADHWGLGMLHNAARDLDLDVASEGDRLEVGGWRMVSASYELMTSGPLQIAPYARPRDATRGDDVQSVTLRLTPFNPTRDQAAALAEQDKPVLRAGVEATWRRLEFAPATVAADRARVDARTQTYDAFAIVEQGGFRAAAEAALVLGRLTEPLPGGTQRDVDVRQWGLAIELRQSLGKAFAVHLDGGFASGGGANGLSNEAELVGSRAGSRLSTFRFHPSYRVDQILWRSLMGAVTGALYVKPGVSLDAAKTDFGELLRLRLDAIYSRAAQAGQTPGNDPDLGVEFDASAEWRSVDGPRDEDGFVWRVQYGLLVPMQGLKNRPGDPEGPDYRAGVAHSLRGVLAVLY